MPSAKGFRFSSIGTGALSYPSRRSFYVIYLPLFDVCLPPHICFACFLIYKLNNFIHVWHIPNTPKNIETPCQQFLS
ncbi:unnamed protein product [Nesidiocoris tenuis]|uniref:Uncharacterized protein n=1 Tax=Nesidiocoris tenuis TaxID=355587 RepID=A0A6H5G1A1_9HEMI|nr:unnamed protein product [Nesidiocoris tenuis]